MRLEKGKKGSDVDKSDPDEKGPSSLNKIDGHIQAFAPVVCEADSSTTATEDDDNTAAQAPQTKRKKLYFQDEWMEKWPWVKDNKDEMRCKLCIKHRKTNKMTKGGCFNYKTTTLARQSWPSFCHYKPQTVKGGLAVRMQL